MRIDSPLINPTPSEVEYKKMPESIAEDSHIAISNEQLRLHTEGRKTSFQQRLNSMRVKLRRRNDMLEVTPLWKSPSIPFMFITFITNIIFFLFGGIVNFGKIPPKIPFFYNSIDNTWQQLDKAVIFIFPLLLSVFFALQFRIIINVFRHDKRLAITISWIMSFLHIMLFITLTQIYFLIT